MRRRIVTLAVLTAALSTALFGVPLVIIARHDAVVHERSEAAELAGRAALAVAPVVATGGPVTAVPLAPEADLTVAVYDADGRRLAGRGPARADTPAQDSLRRNALVADDDSRGEIVVAVPVVVDGVVVAVARAGTPRSEVSTQAALAWALLLLIAGAAVALGWLFAHGLAGRLARPLEELAAGAQRLGEGDFSVRIGRSGVPEVDDAGAALDATATRLGALIARERAFAAAASHQLRTPLTGLRLRLEGGLDGPPADQREALAAALRSADRLEGTIDDLLTLTREARGTEPLDVPALLLDLTEVWAPVLAARDRRLLVHREPDLPGTVASWAAVRQVLTVLVDNATTHGRGDVTITARDAGGLLCVDVADQGEGLIDRVDPLTAARPGDPAAGLGLPLARALTEAEGGRLRLAGTAPTTFALLLPAGEPANHL